MAEATPFRIALTSAGAVSGGPYSAGVIDFIIEALGAWYAAKPPTPEEPRKGIPSHDVRIDAVSGTSAGAVAAGLFPAAVIRNVQHGGGKQPTLLKEVWVDKLDLLYDDGTSRGFLGLSDMQDPGDAIPSLLNSHRLDAIADEAFGTPWSTGFSPPPWLSDALRILLCVTSLPGVPYHIAMHGGTSGAGHDMFQHGDHGIFQFSLAPPTASDARHVTHVDPHGTAGWNTLILWALASAAFPVGLAPRFLHTATDMYQDRRWPGWDDNGCCKEVKASPSLPTGETLRFPAVDGGMVNNEPFDLARRTLAGNVCTHLPREGDKAHAAVVLVDPFPSPFNPAAYRKLCALRADVTEMAGPLLSAMKQQCRFKPEELALAVDEDVYSRFLIAPTGGGYTGKLNGDGALAGAGLGAFAGFLALAFREHDYQLGRRNAQQFLRCHFALPLTNGLFDKDRARYAPNGDLHALSVACTNPGDSPHAPIIPLMASQAAPIDPPMWPALSKGDIAAVGKAMTPRLNTIVSRLGRKTCCLGRVLTSVAWPLVRGKVRGKIVEYMERDLRARNQLIP